MRNAGHSIGHRPLNHTVTDGENGLLAKTADAADLAGKIARLTLDPELQARLSKGARRTAGTTYAPDRHLTLLEQLFSKLARTSRSDATVRRPVEENAG